MNILRHSLRGLIAFAAIAATILFGSCQSDDPVASESDKPEAPSDTIAAGGIKTAPNLLVFRYEDFNDSNDVTIESPDTTLISVNEALAARLHADFSHVSDTIPMSVWRARNEFPFARRVYNAYHQGGRVYLRSVEGDIGDLFEQADVKLTTDICPECHAKKGLSADGHSEVIIPTMIYIKDPQSNESSIKSFTPDEIQAHTNAGGHWDMFDVDRLVNFTLGDAQKSGIECGIKNGKVRSRGSVDALIKIGFFRLNEFSLVFHGLYDAHFPLTFGATGTAKLSKDEDIYDVGTASYVFCIGPVPVYVSFDATINFTASLSVTGRMGITLPVNMGFNFDAGVKYRRGNGWEKVSGGNSWCDLNKKDVSVASDSCDVSPYFNATANTETGIYLKLSSKLYKCAGPYIKIGPSVRTVSSIATSDLNNFQLSSNGTIGIDLNWGAELKVWKWTLARYESRCQLWEWSDLWKFNADIDKSSGRITFK